MSADDRASRIMVLIDRADLAGVNLAGAYLDACYYPHGTVPAGWTRDSAGYLRRSP